MAYTCTGNASDLGTLSSGIWLNSLGSPSDISSLTISGWFAQDYVVGNLNAKISTCYSGSNNGSGSNWAICPDADGGSLAILGQMYVVSFYGQRAASAAGAGGVTSTWHELSEGDSRIKKASVSEMMKVYKDLAKQASNELDYLVANYVQNSQGSRLGRSVEFYSYNPPSAVYPST